MRFLDLAEKRGSIRAFKPDPVPEQSLNQVLEAGRLAPSAANFQPLHFIVVRDEQARARLQEAYTKDWFAKAPVIIVACVDSQRAWTRNDGRNYGTVDAAIAVDHMTLCAADIGLGTCWVGAFDPAKVRAALDIPAGIEPLVMTPLGEPAAKALPKKRKDLKDLVHWERW